jgi:hypothetical protein
MPGRNTQVRASEPANCGGQTLAGPRINHGSAGSHLRELWAAGVGRKRPVTLRLVSECQDHDAVEVPGSSPVGPTPVSLVRSNPTGASSRSGRDRRADGSPGSCRGIAKLLLTHGVAAEYRFFTAT